jgi:hypothetical protein
LKPVHQPRYRRDCLGELIQIDGSKHWWFEDRGPRCTLLVYIDDATSLSRVRAPSTILQRLGRIWRVTASRLRSIPTSTACFGSTRRTPSAVMA